MVHDGFDALAALHEDLLSEKRELVTSIVFVLLRHVRHVFHEFCHSLLVKTKQNESVSKMIEYKLRVLSPKLCHATYN